MTAARAERLPDLKRRAFWLKHLHRWHWISAALSLVGLLGFAITGFTLNHAGAIEAQPQVETRNVQLPEALLAQLREAPANGSAPLPPAVREALARELDIVIDARDAEWSEEEIYLSLQRPGGDAWLSIAPQAGTVEYERTDRGWIAWFNDLHKGRHAGTAWTWFIDAFALACVVFASTGLCLLLLHAPNRPATWPVAALGLLLPLLLILIFIH